MSPQIEASLLLFETRIARHSTILCKLDLKKRSPPFITKVTGRRFLHNQNFKQFNIGRLLHENKTNSLKENSNTFLKAQVCLNKKWKRTFWACKFTTKPFLLFQKNSPYFKKATYTCIDKKLLNLNGNFSSLKISYLPILKCLPICVWRVKKKSKFYFSTL